MTCPLPSLGVRNFSPTSLLVACLSEESRSSALTSTTKNPTPIPLLSHTVLQLSTETELRHITNTNGVPANLGEQRAAKTPAQLQDSSLLSLPAVDI
ncbi:hypothetical protein WN944_012569 [Citrus x changshan-huyou]|uniref:Uncharacterized protein n=1 Tax=Citrus x changshan-huyou TaxID=2935761 RepID=A0AAP0MY44_9ROSI